MLQRIVQFSLRFGLDQKAADVRQVLAEISGATDVQVESQPGAPEMVMDLRPERLRQFGFRPVEVLDANENAPTR